VQWTGMWVILCRSELGDGYKIHNLVPGIEPSRSDWGDEYNIHNLVPGIECPPSDLNAVTTLLTYMGSLKINVWQKDRLIYFNRKESGNT
jgi:hypothetical protein